MASLPFPQSLLVDVCLLVEKSETLKAFPLLWSSDCNRNSHQGVNCHCGYLMIEDSTPERQQGARVSGCHHMAYSASTPSVPPVTNWFVKALGGTLRGKDTLYLLMTNPQRNKKSISWTNFPAWLFPPFNSQLAKSSAPKEFRDQKKKSSDGWFLPNKEICTWRKKKKKTESIVKMRNRKVGSKEGK